MTPPSPSPQPMSLHPSLATLLLDRAPDALLVVSPDGAIIYANAASADILGYTTNELFGMSVESLVAEKNRERHRHRRDAYKKSPVRRAMGRATTLCC